MEASFFGRTGMRFGWEYAGRGRNITRGRLRYKTSIKLEAKFRPAALGKCKRLCPSRC